MASARLLTPAFVALTLADLAYFTGTGVLIVATPLFVVGPLGSDAIGVGVAMGAFSVTTLVLRPWVGRWVDRRGRKRLYVGGAVGFAVLVLSHYVVSDVGWLVVVRLALGAAEAMFFVAGFAILADLAPAGRAGEALSLNSLALYVGVATGPLLGQALLSWGGFGLAWAAAAVCAAAAAVLAARLPETRPVDEPGRPSAALLHRAALVPGLALFCGVATTAGFLAFAVLQARAVDVQAWSVVLVVFGATVVLCRLVFARLPDRSDPSRVTAAALVLAAVGALVVGGIRTPVGLFAGSLVLGVASAFLTPAVFAGVFRVVGASERGAAAATTSIFIDLGLGLGPMLLGFAAAATSLSTAFLLLAALPAAGAALVAATLGRQAAG